MRTGVIAAEMRSGDFGSGEVIEDCRCERLGEMLVEQVIWGRAAPSQRRGDAVVSGSGYVCSRCWQVDPSRIRSMVAERIRRV